MTYIPDYVQGTDIETEDVAPSALILAIGAATINVRTLSIVNTLSLTINPTDPWQLENRTRSDRTIKWWDSAGSDNKWAPSKAAKQIAYSGTTSLVDALDIYNKFIKSNPKGVETVVPMRGPDFDYVILRDAFTQLGMYYEQRASLVDSHRTVERIANVFNLPPITEAEIDRFCTSDRRVEHVALYDAAKEAYETARLYHFCWHVTNNGYAAAMEMVAGWAKGIIIDIPERDAETPAREHVSSC